MSALDSFDVHAPEHGYNAGSVAVATNYDEVYLTPSEARELAQIFWRKLRSPS